MNAAAPDPAGKHQSSPGEGWSRARLIRLIVVVFIAHVALIFIFGARKPITPPAVRDVPQWGLVDTDNELLALKNPALFALPRADPYTAPYRITNSFHWSDPPHWLEFTDVLSGATSRVALPDRIEMARLDVKPPLKLDLPATPIRAEFAPASTLRLEGDLAQRPWITAPQLPSWIDNDVLQPSIVQVLVNSEGDVVSDVLLAPGCGFDAADQKALEIARGIHFTRAVDPTVGEMIFDWRTVPAPETNAAVVSP